MVMNFAVIIRLVAWCRDDLGGARTKLSLGLLYMEYQPKPKWGEWSWLPQAGTEPLLCLFRLSIYVSAKCVWDLMCSVMTRTHSDFRCANFAGVHRGDSTNIGAERTPRLVADQPLVVFAVVSGNDGCVCVPTTVRAQRVKPLAGCLAR